MKAQGVSKAEMARRMHTSRMQLDRLIDPGNDKVQLDTVQGQPPQSGGRSSSNWRSDQSNDTADSAMNNYISA